MEAKLAAYRRRKEEEKQAEQSLINKLKLVITKRPKESQSQHLHDRTENFNHESENSTDPKLVVESEKLSLERKNTKHSSKHSQQQQVETDQGHSAESSTVIKWILKILKVLLWLTLWGFFIELQFGAVFFTLSALIFVYFNTRTGPRDDKPSAYSVFNKDCERIQGTLTAEQMQKQMFGVPGLTS